MLYIVASYEYEDNEFSMKDIYISDESSLYVMSKDQGFLPFSSEGSTVDIVDASKNSVYPLVGFGEIRQYNDDDPKSFATFLHRKIKDVDFDSSEADKALFNVISNFGEPYVQIPI